MYIFIWFSDVITIEKTAENFRLIYDVKGRFAIHRIQPEEAKVNDIKCIAWGKPQQVNNDQLSWLTHDEMAYIPLMLNLLSMSFGARFLCVCHFYHLGAGGLLSMVVGRTFSRNQISHM